MTVFEKMCEGLEILRKYDVLESHVRCSDFQLVFFKVCLKSGAEAQVSASDDKRLRELNWFDDDSDYKGSDVCWVIGLDVITPDMI